MMLAVILLLMAALVVSLPLISREVEAYLAPEHHVPQPFTEKDMVLEGLSDLELSFRSGKLSEADYQRERSKLEREYVALS